VVGVGEHLLERQPGLLQPDANTLGESKRGQQNQSTQPSVVTSAAACRSPMSPWSAIGG
jgi:hypothetical protein